MPILNVTVANKRATGDGQIIVNDNTDYIVRFTFDSEWDDYPAKTMRVSYSNGTYTDVVFNGTDASLPMLQRQNHVHIGVYAGDLHTTTAAHYDVRQSVLYGNETHEDPDPDVYNQIMEAINSGMLRGNGIVEIEKTSTVGLVDTYTITYDDGSTFDYNVTNGAKGDRGDCNFATFAIDPDTGILSAFYTDTDSEITFEINNSGHLEVII